MKSAMQMLSTLLLLMQYVFHSESKEQIRPQIGNHQKSLSGPWKRIIQKGNEASQENKAFELKPQGANHGAPMLRKAENGRKNPAQNKPHPKE